MTVPGRSSKLVRAAVEDACAARHENKLSIAIHESIDKLDLNLVSCLKDQQSSEDDNNH